MEFGQYLAAAVEKVKNALGGGGVAILVPPGSARGEVAKRLVEEGAVDDVLLYEALHKRVGVGRPLKREGGQFYVVVEGGKVPLLQYLKGGVTLGSALRQRKVVIVPRDTQEALLIYKSLPEELKREKLWRIEGGVKELVKVLFLPANYKESDEEVAKLARVDYDDALRNVAEDWKGVSPSLARLTKEYKARGGLDNFKQLIAAIRGLAPERSAKALYELAGEVGGGFASEAASKAVEEAPGILAAGAALAAMGMNPLAIVAGAAAGWAARKIIDGVKELLDKARGRRADVAKDVLALVQGALGVYSLLCSRERAEELERLEAVVDEVAAKWGMSLDQFKAFLCNLGALATSKVVTEKELEERLMRLEELVSLRSSAPAAVYVKAWEWPYVAEAGEGLVVLEGAVRGPYVENKLEEELLKRLEAAVGEARRGVGRIILLRGTKGVGKSTAVAAALYKLLKGGKVAVAVFDLGAVVDETRTVQFLSEARRRGFVPHFYLDPSRLEFYSSHTLARPPIAQAVRNLVKLVELAKRHGAVALVVLSEDQIETIARPKEQKEGEEEREKVEKVLPFDADEVKAGDVIEVEPFVKALVEKYSGCSSDVVEGTAKAVASSFKDGYAVAAVLAADWLKSRGCRGEEVERAVKEAEGNVHRFVLHYLWYGLFNGNNVTAERYAPLLLAVGFFGPHPPKLAEAIVRAFGEKPEDAVIRWFSQPLHGTLYEAIGKVAHSAVYRQFGVGSDELCQGGMEEPCRLVEICAEALADVPPRGYSGVIEVAEEYAKLVAETLRTPGPTKRRPIYAFIQSFLHAFNGKKVNDHWKIRYEAKGPDGVKTVEDIVDELDILSALYGLAVLPRWDPQLKPLEGWFFVGGSKVDTVKRYLYPLLRERGRELAKRAMTVVGEMKKRGGYTDVDVWRAVGIAAASQWDSATDEELEKAVRLVATALHHYASALTTVLDYVKSLLSEAWRRVVSWRVSGGGGRRQRLADMLAKTIYNTARGRPSHLPHIFAPEKEKPDSETVAQRFDALYNAASNAGRLLLLETLLYALAWDIGIDNIAERSVEQIPQSSTGRNISETNVAAVLLGNPRLGQWGAFEEVARRVEEFVTHLNDIEGAFAMAGLYSWLAEWYALLGELDKAIEYVDKALKALENLQVVYKKDKASTVEKLRSYLELIQIKPNLKRKLDDIKIQVYHRVAIIYIMADKLGNAVVYAKKACKLAKKLGRVYYYVQSCSLLSRLKTIRNNILPVKEFEELWQRALQDVGRLGAEPIVAIVGNYVLALTSVRRFDDVEKVLKEWSWALELHPIASALTYGVLSLFDERYLEKVIKSLPERARDNLQRITNEDAVKALVEMTLNSMDLFLFTLIGLAHCKRGEEWGLKLAKEAARAGSGSKGIVCRLFGELARALDGATVGGCVTDDVLRAVYKLYYFHV